MSGAAPERRFCSQISWPGTFRVQLPVGATSSCAKPVAVLASSCSLATPVLAVFFSTAPATASGGRVAHRQHPAEALRLVAFGREQHIGGGIHDPGPGGATDQSEVRDACLGHDARRGHLRGGSQRARNRQARAQHCDAVHTAVDRKKVVSDPGRDLVPRTGPSAGPETSSMVSRWSHLVGTAK